MIRNEICTQRLTLRPFDEGDAAAVANYWNSDPNWSRFNESVPLDSLKLFHERLLYPQTFIVLNGSGEGWHGAAEGVSKRTMIGTTQVMLQAERLRVAKGLDLGQALFDELLNFRMKPPRADATVEAMREGQNDDLVYAVSLACWWSDRLVWNEEDDTWPEDDAWDSDDEDRSIVGGY